MAVESKKDTVKSVDKTERTSKKVTKKVLVSVLKYDKKVLSVIGIPNSSTSVSHTINRKDLSLQEWSDLAKALTSKNVFHKTIKEKLLTNVVVHLNSPVTLPSTNADEFPVIGKLRSDISSVDISI